MILQISYIVVIPNLVLQNLSLRQILILLVYYYGLNISFDHISVYMKYPKSLKLRQPKS